MNHGNQHSIRNLQLGRQRYGTFKKSQHSLMETLRVHTLVGQLELIAGLCYQRVI